MSEAEGTHNPGADEALTWHGLRDGCAYGIRLTDRVHDNREKVGEIKDCLQELERKVDRMTWALATTGISFGLTAVGLLLNWLT